jgi:maltose alpha-D-glucosyltransferase/alpha-amylase
MIRSFHYAAYGAIFLDGDPNPERRSTLSPRAEDWYHTVSDVFLKSYLTTISRGKAELLPAEPEELNRLLEVFLLEKAIYELNYELNNRPEWVIIPLRGIISIGSPSSCPEK